MLDSMCAGDTGRCLQRQDVDDGRLLSSGAYWTLQASMRGPVQKDDEFADITAAVLASAVCRTDRNVHVIRKRASSSINIIVFINDSAW